MRLMFEPAPSYVSLLQSTVRANWQSCYTCLGHQQNALLSALSSQMETAPLTSA